jgi:hypothetical protein
MGLDNEVNYIFGLLDVYNICTYYAVYFQEREASGGEVVGDEVNEV